MSHLLDSEMRKGRPPCQPFQHPADDEAAFSLFLLGPAKIQKGHFSAIEKRPFTNNTPLADADLAVSY